MKIKLIIFKPSFGILDSRLQLAKYSFLTMNLMFNTKITNSGAQGPKMMSNYLIKLMFGFVFLFVY